MNRPVMTVGLIICAAAQGAGPVILFETKVSQFREAATAAQALVPSAEIDIADEAGVAKLSGASVVLAIGQKAFALAMEKVPKSPIVFCLVIGVTRDHLKDNITGVPFEADPLISVSMLQEVVPGAKRIGLIYNPATSDWFASEALRAANAAGVTLVMRTAATPQEARDASKVMLQVSQALWLAPDPKLFPKDLVLFFLTASAERSKPVIGFLDSMAQTGALASNVTDFAEAGRHAGRLAAEIASRPEGHRLPVPAPSWAPGKLILNLKTAESLNIKPTAAAGTAAAQVLK